MIAGLNVITDNLDYLLWGRAATGEPGGVLLSLMMAAGAAIIALPGGIALACLAWRFTGLVRKALFLWAELIRGIPLIFVIFWMWYLLPLMTGSDLPGALTVTLALAWFTAATVMHSVLAGLNALPSGQYEAALSQGFSTQQNPPARAAAAGAEEYSAVAGGDFYQPAEGYVAGVYRERTGADHGGGQVNNRVQIYPAAIFIFTGVVYYLLCCSLEQLAKRWRITRPAL
ncbi:binding-protein-dependent transport system inner membrane protein [Enterobacter asburiae]|uniref:Binding-protein-dependent transport system inner membrane protein n=1 Tax=Enterobacter asburiae TaxID=61645 RepID=A0A376F948_ENTAS|nr:binding-protein-dependent transport system inner membrane protein [Enterobacter asburiae]